MEKSITIKNEKQISTLELITSIDQRIILETTSYFEDDGSIFRTSVQKDIYNKELSLECLKSFYNIQLNNLIEFYRVQGEFKFKIQ